MRSNQTYITGILTLLNSAVPFIMESFRNLYENCYGLKAV